MKLHCLFELRRKVFEKRYLVSSGSPVTSVTFLPMLRTKFKLSLFHDPIDWIATGTNMCVCSSTAYLVLLLAAALSAAAPAVVDVVSRCDVAIVSGTVTSHVRQLPTFIVIIIISIINRFPRANY